MSQLQQLLNLSAAPVAITFRPTAPEGSRARRRAQPAGCGYWRRAAAGEIFYTNADDHKGCPVGAHTHGVTFAVGSEGARGPGQDDGRISSICRWTRFRRSRRARSRSASPCTRRSIARRCRRTSCSCTATRASSCCSRRPRRPAGVTGRGPRRWDGPPARSCPRRSTRSAPAPASAASATACTPGWPIPRRTSRSPAPPCAAVEERLRHDRPRQRRAREVPSRPRAELTAPTPPRRDERYGFDAAARRRQSVMMSRCPPRPSRR